MLLLSLYLGNGSVSGSLRDPERVGKKGKNVAVGKPPPRNRASGDPFGHSQHGHRRNKKARNQESVTWQHYSKCTITKKYSCPSSDQLS